MALSENERLQCDRELLDHDSLVERCMGNYELAHRLMTRYADSGLQECEQLEMALRDRQPTVLAAVAHRIKGSAASIGSARVSGLAARIETECGFADWNVLASLVQELRGAQMQVGNQCYRMIQSYTDPKEYGGGE